MHIYQTQARYAVGPLFTLYISAMMDSFNWLVEAPGMKDVWSATIIKNGQLFVMMYSINLMQQSSVDKRDIPKWVCMSISTFTGTYG